jgi:uncharacterized protein (DUF1778 family)
MDQNGKRLTERVTVNFSRSDLQMLREICEHRCEDISGFIRSATLKRAAQMQFFPVERKKALEILPDQHQMKG